MPGLYVHVPFCARRCPYCDFAVTVNRDRDFRAAYVGALKSELEAHLAHCQLPLETIHFGGGTPTELPAAQLNSLLAHIRSLGAGLAPGAEVTLEANPENLDAQYLEELARGGWNRISVGAQSFDDAILKYLGRGHTGADVERVVAQARAAGWQNVSLDLIYAVPGQSLDLWRETLDFAVQLGVPHVSAYGLTIEPGTAFGLWQSRGKLHPVADDEQARFMDLAQAQLEAAGLFRYEVSNYAWPGHESRHNQNYWRGGDYLGAGSGAHGHAAGHRWWNQRDARVYVRQMAETGTARAGEERLTTEERLSELVALGLRSREGLDLKAASLALGIDVAQRLGPALQRARRLDWIELTQGGTRLRATPEMVKLADGLALELLCPQGDTVGA